jgi:hypothetical protein
MKKLIWSVGIASLATLALAATVAAAGPHGAGAAAGQGQSSTPGQNQGTVGGPANGAQAGRTDVIAGILGMTQAEIAAQRQAGASLAQIAEKKGIDPQKLVDALVGQWSTRIDYRVSVGALTTAQAAALKDQLQVRAKDMVYKVTLGGMQGAAVGAGPTGDGSMRGTGRGMNAGNGRGRGAGNGACDGTGPNAPAQP